MRTFLSVLAFLAVLTQTAALSRDPKIVLFPRPSSVDSAQHVFSSTQNHPDELTVFSAENHGRSVPILTDSKDNVAIHIAVASVADDIEKITGRRPETFNDTLPSHFDSAVIVGSVDSSLIRKVDGTDYVDEIKGKWESFDLRTLKKPLKGLKEGLVITGSDRVRTPPDCVFS